MAKSLVKMAQAALPQSAPAPQKNLLSELAAFISPEDENQFDSALLEKMGRAQWDLSKKRGTGASQMRAYHSTVGGHRKTVIDVVGDDMAFLVDSIAAEINKNNYLVDLLVHPIFYAQYSNSGALESISVKPGKNTVRQSHIHVHIKNTLSDESLKALEQGLRAALDDVRTCNRDWQKMLQAMEAARDELLNAKTGHSKQEIERYCAFLSYLHNNNFTLLGYREYEFTESNSSYKSKTLKGKGLGLLHDDVRPAYISETDEGLPRNLQNLRRNLPPVSVSKTNRLATVHRRVPMDAIAVKTYDKNGKVKGEKLFLGLFTSVTYSRSVSDVPFLREKVDEVVAMSDYLPGSHNSKALRHILEKYPRDELFQITNEELFKICNDILRLQERQRIAVFMRRDSFGRYVSCLVYIPRDRFGTALRKRIMRILEQELSGACSNFYTNMDDSVYARVMFTIDVSQKNPPQFDPDKIEEKIREEGQTWTERLSHALLEVGLSDNEAARLTLKYGEAFQSGYISRHRAKQAVFDIQKIERTLANGRINVDLYHLEGETENTLRLKAYNPEKPLNLSDVLPILENLDLRAISEYPYEIKAANESRAVWIHDFTLECASNGHCPELNDVKAGFEEAFEKVWYNDVENDSLNRLVMRAKLGWREIIILRTYVRYLRQVNAPFSFPYIQDALVSNPDLSRLLSEMFTAIHNPAGAKKDRVEMVAGYVARVHKSLEKVESLDHDRIIRSIAMLVEATVRTNYFQSQPDGAPKSYLSIKLESQRIIGLPEPKPFREIFVYSPRVEAVHLRADKISRGGIRWSDRHEDFRTEVLGLMKAQQVKNSVIVPMGAKGGFVVKTPIKDRKAFQLEGIECYKILIRGLLDITDNLRGEKVIHPKDVVRLDGDDPYLVVAADKGTASFSDIANAISLEYGFWLGDAFASGGSAGYDHKGMGITAKGAWESVKLHFRQLNHDIQQKPFDVVGVGDMSGDVFGNGMLLSKETRMIGAFNHIHIVCDPDPDAAVSFKERKRLFDNVLGWDQYDTKKLSKGGRIFVRTEKTLTLTPEIQKRFDISKDKVTPIELIRALLMARTDLLYFGGIGTYVKSTKQTNADVGDKTNDALRIDATQLRARVLGEGANLAMTQLARVEFAEHGGRVNTDFVDNSAGVDTSDHEVNIKILLTDVMAQKTAKMDLKSRNALLEQMTGEVAALVLRDNYQQAQAISLAEFQGRDNLKYQENLIQYLERAINLKRSNEGLPSRAEVEQRIRLGKSLTRPELCILLSYAKITFTQDLLATDIPDSPETHQWLVNYFPKELQKKYSKEISRHKLHREIVAMSIANAVINRMGPSFVTSCAAITGAAPDQIARAFLIVQDAFDLPAFWAEIEKLDNKVPADVQMKAMREAVLLAEHAIVWFLTRKTRDLQIAANTKLFKPAIERLRKSLDKPDTEETSAQIDQRTDAGIRDGLPKPFARQVALLPVLATACDIARISQDEKIDLEVTARAYHEVDERFHLGWLRQQALFMPTDTLWQSEANYGLVDTLYTCQANLTTHILKESGKSKDSVAKWVKKNAAQVQQVEQTFNELRQAGTIDLAMLVIAEQRLRGLYGG